MKKIVSHKPPRHLDDWLAICLLKNLYPQAQIEYIHPQEIPEEYLEKREICLVDVGMRYEPQLNNLDHHHNLEIPSSVILVLRHFYPQVDSSAKFLRAIDTIDRFGIQSALKEGLIRGDRSTDEKRRVLLLMDISPQSALLVWQAIKFAAKMNASYESFMEFLYSLLLHTEELQKAREQVEREKQELERRLREIKVHEVNGIKVGISTESLAPRHSEVFQRTGVDILIERNSMNREHTSLIVNTFSPNKDRAYEIREEFIKEMPVVFRHQTGFIVVVDKSVEEFQDDILRGNSEGYNLDIRR